MALILVIIVLALIVIGPTLWVKAVMSRHAGNRPDLPGTGGELAQHLIANCMPQVVVDGFEMVQVKHEKEYRQTIASAALELLVSQDHEVAPVVYTGERIRFRQTG